MAHFKCQLREHTFVQNTKMAQYLNVKVTRDGDLGGYGGIVEERGEGYWKLMSGLLQEKLIGSLIGGSDGE